MTELFLDRGEDEGTPSVSRSINDLIDLHQQERRNANRDDWRSFAHDRQRVSVLHPHVNRCNTGQNGMSSESGDESPGSSGSPDPATRSRGARGVGRSAD